MAKKVNQPIQNTPRQPVKNIPTAKTGPTTARKPWPMTTKLWIILAIISFLVYSNTMQNGYVLDDVMILKENTIVPQGLKAIPELLSTLRLKGYSNMSNEYRPLSLVMFAIECQFAALNPTVNHFFNTLVFVGCVVLLFLFLNLLFEGRKTAVAFITALLWALHPIHTEIVANIKSRDELLCFFFAFMALFYYAKYMKSGLVKQLGIGALAMFLSLLSKETVITFIGVIPLVFFLYLNNDKKRSLFITGSAVLAAVLFLVIRGIVIYKYNNGRVFPINFVDNSLVQAPNAMSKLATEILILGYYFKMLFIPYPLICDHSYNSIPYTTFGDIWVILSLVIYVGLGIIAVIRLLKDKKDPWAFGILFFLFTISLFSNIVIMLASTMAERFLFFCSVGTCLLIALAIEKWLIRKENADASTLTNNKVLFVLVPVCLIFAGITYGRNADWKTNYTLYKADVEKLPQNIRLNYYIASEMQRMYEAETDPVKQKQLNDESIAHLRKALSIYANYTDGNGELGASFLRAKQYDSAEHYLKRAIELNPKQSNALANLGTMYLTLVNYPQALYYYRRTVQANPRNAVAQFNGAVCYYQLQKYDSAILGFKATMEIAPDFYNYKSYEFTSIIYKLLNQMDSARKYELIAQQYNSSYKLQ